MPKDNDLVLEISDITERGQGVARFEGKVIFVDDAVPGDRVKVEIIQSKKSYNRARIITLISASPHRVEPPCPYAFKCGGCSVQHIEYDSQLQYKESSVHDALQRIGKQTDYRANQIVAMTFPYRFRNKALYPFANLKGQIELGFYKRGSHQLVPIDHCIIQMEGNDALLTVVKQWANRHQISVYNEKTQRGLLRHLMIRTSVRGAHMIGLVINGDKLPKQQQLVDELLAVNESISSIVLNFSKKPTNTVLAKHFKTIYGNDYLTDEIRGVSYRIAMASFFQVNPSQTAKLYEIVSYLADLSGSEIVWDIYCGVGSIALQLAGKAKWVYGNEIVKSAVDNARINAAINQIDNVTFMEGAAESIVPRWLEDHQAPDLVVLDPPRKGVATTVLDAIVKMSPDKIIYVSCKASTLARDIDYLTTRGYQLVEVTPLDMFAHSMHVETVCLLTRK